MKLKPDRVFSAAFLIALASLAASVVTAATTTSIAPIFGVSIRNYENRPGEINYYYPYGEVLFLNFNNDPFESRMAIEFPSSEIPADTDSFQLRSYLYGYYG